MSKSQSEARRIYLEQYGSALVTNNYLRVALVALSGLSLGMLVLCGMTVHWAKGQKPLVVRIDEVGRAAAIDYRLYEYKPQEKELRYFLSQFVQFHYGRILSTVQDHYAKSLFFLDTKLSQALIDDERRNQTLARFMKDSSEESDIAIRNVALQDLRSTPIKATVDFEKIFYTRGDHRELRREAYAGYFEFVVRDVPNDYILVNPLGLTITYFRADAGFK